ncbi:hypothetical protein CRUP_020592 [Coryphaenoides rupestris]|nr:hypothetical protein CRUP_020592 [Coryphaenoides rupestris]
MLGLVVSTSTLAVPTFTMLGLVVSTSTLAVPTFTMLGLVVSTLVVPTFTMLGLVVLWERLFPATSFMKDSSCPAASDIFWGVAFTAHLPTKWRCAVNATPQKMSDAAGQLESFMKDVAGNRRSHKTTRPNIVKRPLEGSAASRKLVSEVGFQPCQMKTFYPMPFPVNFVSESVRTVPFTHADHASLSILARMMTAKYLHGEIREKGGAYGGGARMGSGLFSFYSYRDPNSVQTLSAFRRGADWARSGSFSQQDIDEAKLSVFSAVDAPVAPSDKGMGRFLNGLTDEARQGHRERLFAVSDKDLADVASRYLGFGQQISGAAILGPENEGLKKDPSWIVK